MPIDDGPFLSDIHSPSPECADGDPGMRWGVEDETGVRNAFSPQLGMWGTTSTVDLYASLGGRSSASTLFNKCCLSRQEDRLCISQQLYYLPCRTLSLRRDDLGGVGDTPMGSGLATFRPIGFCGPTGCTADFSYVESSPCDSSLLISTSLHSGPGIPLHDAAALNDNITDVRDVSTAHSPASRWCSPPEAPTPRHHVRSCYSGHGNHASYLHRQALEEVSIRRGRASAPVRGYPLVGAFSDEGRRQSVVTLRMALHYCTSKVLQPSVPQNERRGEGWRSCSAKPRRGPQITIQRRTSSAVL